MLQHSVFCLCFMMFQFVIIVQFQLFFQILDKFLFIKLAFDFFSDLVRENLHCGVESTLDFFQRHNSKSCESEPKEIELIHFWIISNFVTRDLWFVDFEQDSISCNTFNFLNLTFSFDFIIDPCSKTDQVII